MADMLFRPECSLLFDDLQPFRITETGIAEFFLFMDIVLEKAVECIYHVAASRLQYGFGAQPGIQLRHGMSLTAQQMCETHFTRPLVTDHAGMSGTGVVPQDEFDL